jgi:hypothetical protein
VERPRELASFEVPQVGRLVIICWGCFGVSRCIETISTPLKEAFLHNHMDMPPTAVSSSKLPVVHIRLPEHGVNIYQLIGAVLACIICPGRIRRFFPPRLRVAYRSYRHAQCVLSLLSKKVLGPRATFISPACCHLSSLPPSCPSFHPSTTRDALPSPPKTSPSRRPVRRSSYA